MIFRLLKMKMLFLFFLFVLLNTEMNYLLSSLKHILTDVMFVNLESKIHINTFAFSWLLKLQPKILCCNLTLNTRLTQMLKWPSCFRVPAQTPRGGVHPATGARVQRGLLRRLRQQAAARRTRVVTEVVYRNSVEVVPPDNRPGSNNASVTICKYTLTSMFYFS